MYLKASDVRALAELASWDDCTDGRLCYAAPMGPEVEEDARRPYGVPLDEFVREYPFVAGRALVEMDRCPGAVPRIVVYLDPGEDAMILMSPWRGYEVVKRVREIDWRPRGAFGGEDSIPSPSAQEAAFPVGPAVVAFGIVFGAFVLSFFVKRSPAGRWYLGSRST